jgi:mono/diheme cytochrome c family protein
VGLAPSLKGDHWARLGADRGYLPMVLVHGLSGPIKVNGGTFIGSMPPFGPQLDDNTLALIATHLRSLQGAGTDTPFGADDFKAARALPGGRRRRGSGGCSCSGPDRFARRWLACRVPVAACWLRWC